MEVITTYKRIYNNMASNIIYFDLDLTLITSIFTSMPPHEVMVFCKQGEYEPRYSIIRPGAYELLKNLHESGANTGIITDAKANRATKIINQFCLANFIDVLITQEALIETELHTGIPRKSKPLTFYNGIHLFDDNIQACEANNGRSTKILPFHAELRRDGSLYCYGSQEKWINWCDEFRDIEFNYFTKLYFHVENL